MSDKKDKQSTDLEANLVKIANTKPRLRTRKHNIYERYITRVGSVQTIDSMSNTNERASTITNTDDKNDVDVSAEQHILQPLKNADKLSSYEPLSAEELELFTIQELDSVANTAERQTSDNSSHSISLDFSNDNDNDNDNEEVIHPPTTTEATAHTASTMTDDKDNKGDNAEVNDSAYIDDPDSTASLATLPIKKPKKKKAAKSIQTQKSSKKPLIIGMVLGSLMISGAVFTLIATGFLSTGTTAPNDAGMITPSDKSANRTIPMTEQTGTEMKGAAENVVVAADKPTTDVEDPLESNSDSNSNSNSDKSSIAESQTESMNNKNEAAIIVPKAEKAEPAITYEDFREESQNTLYRETND